MPASDTQHRILCDIWEYLRSHGTFPNVRPFRLEHERDRPTIDALAQTGDIRREGDRYELTMEGLIKCNSPSAIDQLRVCNRVLDRLRQLYRSDPDRLWMASPLAAEIDSDVPAVQRALTLMSELPIWSGLQRDDHSRLVVAVRPSENILDIEPIAVPDSDADVPDMPSNGRPRIQRIEISGYRPFRTFSADPGDLTVIIGANATGKSSLFDFLRFFSYAVSNPLPPEIDPATAGKTLFHVGGPERLSFSFLVDMRQRRPLRYDAEIRGPVGSPRVTHERLTTVDDHPDSDRGPFIFLDFKDGRGVVRDQIEKRLRRPEWTVQPNELALRRALDPTLVTLSKLQAFVSSWRFYSGFDVSGSGAIRRPVPTEPTPALADDGANLSAVLFSMMTEQSDAWNELETHLRSAIPGFQSLSVKPRGGPGTVIAIWREQSVRGELTLADLSDGTLRLLCWATLCLSTSLPPLVCIDEPELGLHPRVLPMLVGLLRLAAARSQIIVATHSPYFLSHCSLDEIAVMRKVEGASQFLRPRTSPALRQEIEEIGNEALARLHISDELEARS